MTGSEICELVGLYILNKLTEVYKNNSSIGLFRDDGLAVFQGIGPRTADKIRQKFLVIRIRIKYHPANKSESPQLPQHIT